VPQVQFDDILSFDILDAVYDQVIELFIGNDGPAGFSGE